MTHKMFINDWNSNNYIIFTEEIKLKKKELKMKKIKQSFNL